MIEVGIGILIFIALVYIIYKYYKAWGGVLIALVYLSGVCVYYVGLTGLFYFEFSEEYIVKGIWSLVASVTMFSFSNQLNSISEALSDNIIYLGWFWVTHFLAMQCTIITVFYLVHHQFSNYYRLLRRHWRKSYICIGISEELISFIESLLHTEEGKKACIIVIDEKEAIKAMKEENRLKVAVVKGDPCEEHLLKQYILGSKHHKEAPYVMVLGEEVTKNVDIMIAIREMIEHHDLHDFEAPQDLEEHEKLQVIGQVAHTQWHQYIDPKGTLNLRLFKYADAIVKQLVEVCPSYEVMAVDTQTGQVHSDYTLMVIGFGEVGQRALLQMTSFAQYENSHFKAIVVDKNMTTVKGQFTRQYPGFMKQYDVTFYEMDCNEEAFNQLLEEYIQAINCMVICLREDEKNLELGLQMINWIRQKDLQGKRQIAARYCYDTHLTKVVHPDKGALKELFLFGRLNEIYTKDILINEILDIRAKAINDNYNAHNPKYATPWEGLDYFSRDSNRHCAMHIRTKLALVGLRIGSVEECLLLEENQTISTTEAFVEYIGSVRLEHLAILEHMRWNAFHFASGWDTLGIAQLKPNEKKTGYVAKDKVRRRHACLVSWEALDEVSKKMEEDYKQKDRDGVKEIVEYLARTGEVLVIEA